ncbi:MAG TPA: hypothetical protein PLU53_07220 [Bacteroidia bacterium]|nr:hypothetical protein [Bacteroidia bacterium]
MNRIENGTGNSCLKIFFPLTQVHEIECSARPEKTPVYGHLFCIPELVSNQEGSVLQPAAFPDKAFIIE